MNVEDVIKILENLRTPVSTKEKSTTGKKLEQMYYNARIASEVYKWIEAGVLYAIKEYGLHNYIYGKTHSLKAFFEELGIPPSSASQRIAMWEFYKVKHKIPNGVLWKADIHKLTRALSYLKDKDAARVKEIVELAERGKLGRIDFLKEVGQLS